MKRVWRLAQLLVLLTVLPLYAEEGVWYLSNELMMPLQMSDEATASREPYSLYVTRSGAEFYKNGELEATRTEENSSSGTTIRVSYRDGRIEESIYTSDLLQKEVFTDGRVQEIILYRYESDQLVERKELRQGQMEKLISYYRHEDGTLAGTREIRFDDVTSITFYSTEGDISTVARQAGEEVVITDIFPEGVMKDTYIKEGVPVQAYTAIYDEIGRLIIDEVIGTDTRKTVYGPDGMLLEETTTAQDGKVTYISYEYDAQGNLIHANESSHNGQSERIERWYSKGKVKNETQWIDEMPQKSTRFNEDGTSVVTIFETGRPYADVTYASDGKRILSIEYRKEQ